jgi:hypothetical protein
MKELTALVVNVILDSMVISVVNVYPISGDQIVWLVVVMLIEL